MATESHNRFYRAMQYEKGANLILDWFYSVSPKSDPPKRLALTSANLHHVAHN